MPLVPCGSHIGSLRLRAGEGSSEAAVVEEWRQGMAAVAALPQVCVKLSMLGYSVPGWHETPEREAFARSLVREVISLFGPDRCMFASNFPVSIKRRTGSYLRSRL